MTPRLLERIGVGPGARCLDVGCGGGDASLALARFAGPGGEVVGVDIDEVKLRIAREEAAAAGLANVEYRSAGVDELPRDGACCSPPPRCATSASTSSPRASSPT
jgi:ubiquinone/menaquinone biosynthesis C-methylase UbiE